MKDLNEVRYFDLIAIDPATTDPVITMLQIRCGHCHERYVIRSDGKTQFHNVITGDEHDQWSARCPFCNATNAFAVRVVERFCESRVRRKERIGTPIIDAIEEASKRLKNEGTG